MNRWTIVSAYGLLGATLLSVPVAAATPQTGGLVSPGDIVETNMNYQPVTGEVLRSYGNLADLNLGQNNVGKYLEVQYMKVVQRAGAGGTSNIGPGDTVRRSNGAIVITGRIMKTNGAYCEIDSSGSGFTGWSKCSDVVRPSGATCAPPTAAAQGRAGGAAAAAGPQPPRPGLTSCAGKIEGRSSSAVRLAGLAIEFR